MTTMFEIIIPQAIRSILPSLGNEFIMLLKDSSLITVIGGKELLYAAQGIMNRTYEPMFPLLRPGRDVSGAGHAVQRAACKI